MLKFTRTCAAGAALAISAVIVSCARGGSGSSTYGDGEGLLPSTPGAGDGGSELVIGGGRPRSATAATVPCMIASRGCTSMCTDFPAKQLTDQAPQDGSGPVPARAPSRFTGNASTGGGPCIVEPQDGTLIPQNWLRPRFRFIPAAGQNLFQIRLHADSEVNDYVLYTTSTVWTMPRTDWDHLRTSVWGQNITVTVAGVNTNDPSSRPSASSVVFQVAPAGAGGAMIYWAAVGDKKGMSWLEGFNVGDETVATVLTPADVQLQISRDSGGQLQNGGSPQGAGAVECIGCHAAIPDGVDGGVGTSVAFDDFYPWTGVVARVDTGAHGAIPPWLTGAGAQAFSQPWIGLPSFSKTDWASGEHLAVASYGCPPGSPGTMGNWYPWNGSSCSDQPNSGLAWFDLSSKAPIVGGTNSHDLGMAMLMNQGTTWGILARDGDPRGAEFANWSHDGANVVYVSTNAGKDGRLASGTADLYTVPFNARQGGGAAPVTGAADPSWAEFYPSFSPNDAFIAYNRAPGSEDMYYNPHDETYIVLSSGGTPIRLRANDPPACSGVRSPGVTNSWPKWSPSVQSCSDGVTYYWIVFSSSRDGNSFNPANLGANPSNAGKLVPTSQLYLTAITVNPDTRAIKTYPALYIWNQPKQSTAFPGSQQSNHTPVWEELAIPPPPPPPDAGPPPL